MDALPSSQCDAATSWSVGHSMEDAVVGKVGQGPSPGSVLIRSGKVGAAVNEMIEPVARAIHKSFYVGKTPESEAWASYSTSHQSGFFDSARAAIEAMREPTDVMVDAVNEALEDCEYDAAYICRLVIDKALE